ncbi:class I SAM-dependent methyltransferase [Candidatus Thorarchaeota archaeon]|nr:class I SAM-dependent methyltransferase [Candidatus Thorarchaeota archaeon]TFH00029.1 MAG: class I SAM-dependent methyltransferase [Candidatus Thorarchaeota archaeon]
MEEVELGWNEFWAEIFRIKHRRSIQGIQHYDKMVVDFCVKTLSLKKEGELLDIACGAGDQSVEFAKLGINVTAFDISERLIKYARECADAHGVSVNFFTGDMLQMPFENQFNAAVLLSHSFGFFNHEENKQVLKDTHKALKKGGRLLIDLMNPYNIPKFMQTWSALEGGYLLSEPHQLDAPAGVLRGRPATFIDTDNNRIVLMSEDARSNNDIRMYTALEIHAMLEETGFTNIEFYGQNKIPRMPYSAGSERMVVVASK